LMSATTFGHDGDISWKFFDEKYTADLANGLGNLVFRVLSMIEKYFNSFVPIKKEGVEAEIPKKLLHWEGYSAEYSGSPQVDKFIVSQIKSYISSINKLEIDKALLIIMGIIKVLNVYINDYKPYKLITLDRDKTATVLYNCVESLRILSIMIYPFIPETADKILEQLGQPKVEKIKDFKKAIEWSGLPENAKIKKGDILFPRLEK